MIKIKIAKHNRFIGVKIKKTGDIKRKKDRKIFQFINIEHKGTFNFHLPIYATILFIFRRILI